MAGPVIGPKPQEDKSERLSKIHVLVADHDPRIAQTVRQVLESFGFREIQVVHDAQEAIAIVKKSPVDLIITEWPMAPKEDMDMVEFIRKSEESPRKDLPVIVLTGRAERPDVITARDHGVTEFVVKPFTAQTLSHRITQVIDNPRSFIITDNFVGPDRRRHKEEDDAANDNRMSSDEMEEHVEIIDGQKVYDVNGTKVVINAPNTDLQEAIGSDIKASAILDEDAIRKAQSVIFDMRDEYMEWVAVDINRLEYTCKMLETRPDDSKQRAALAEIAFSIKSQAGTFGYHLASAVAKLLHDYVSELKQVDKPALMVVKKHVDTLLIIFHQEIAGSGEKIGEEVLDNLKLLIARSATGKIKADS